MKNMQTTEQVGSKDQRKSRTEKIEDKENWKKRRYQNGKMIK